MMPQYQPGLPAVGYFLNMEKTFTNQTFHCMRTSTYVHVNVMEREEADANPKQIRAFSCP